MRENQYIITLLLLLTGFTLSPKAHAQYSDTIQLELFEYTESRDEPEPGFKRTMIDSQTLASYGYQNLSDLLETQSPIYIKSYGLGGLSTPSFRGTGASHTQIAWNGIPVNSPMNGTADLTLFPVALMDGLSIGYGSGSIAGRPGGIGGRINLENHPDWSKGFNGQLTQHFGSFGNYQTFAQIGLGNKKWQSESHIYYRTAENDYPYKNLAEAGHPVERENNAAFSQYGVMEELYFKASNNDYLSAHVWYQSTFRELPAPVTVANRSQEQEDKHLRSLVKWHHYWKNGRLEVKSAFLKQNLHFWDHTVQIDALHKSWSSMNEVSVRQKTGKKGVLNSGITYDHHWAESDGYEEIQRQEQISWYSKYKHSFLESFKVFGRLQQEMIDGEFAPLLPTLGLSIMPFVKNRFEVRGNISRNYRVPSLNDLYWSNGGNPNLKPEKGWSQEAGLGYNFQEKDQLLEKFDIGFTVYKGLYDNWIMWTPNKTGIWEAENIKKVLTRGLETQLQTRWNFSKTQFTLGGQYSYTQSKNLKGTSSLDASDGKQLIYVPFHKGGLNASVEISGIRASYQYQYTGKRYTTRDHSSWLEEYYLSNIGISKGFGWKDFKISAQFRVENLLDTYYEEMAWRPMPGRSFHVKINLQYGQ